jgi:hypothetical protein
MDWIAGRWLVAAMFGGIAIWLSVMNWIVLVQRQRSSRAPSWIPLLGGVCGALALFIQPDAKLREFWWLALVADGGSAPGLLWTLVWHVRRHHRPRSQTDDEQ